MNVMLVYKYYPERNGIDDIETDLTPIELVVGINNKTIKILGEYLHGSKQWATQVDGVPQVTIE